MYEHVDENLAFWLEDPICIIGRNSMLLAIFKDFHDVGHRFMVPKFYFDSDYKSSSNNGILENRHCI